MIVLIGIKLRVVCDNVIVESPNVEKGVEERLRDNNMILAIDSRSLELLLTHGCRAWGWCHTSFAICLNELAIERLLIHTKKPDSQLHESNQ